MATEMHSAQTRVEHTAISTAHCELQSLRAYKELWDSTHPRIEGQLCCVLHGLHTQNISCVVITA
eukprot:m.1433250 g.1433250  ORF g.1433250 m.1433250 type:complete len:65 (+) comp25080_c0_seq1:3875-4069(+)